MKRLFQVVAASLRISDILYMLLAVVLFAFILMNIRSVLQKELTPNSGVEPRTSQQLLLLIRQRRDIATQRVFYYYELVQHLLARGS